MATVLTVWRHGDAKCRQIARNFVDEKMLATADHAEFLRELADKWKPVAANLDATLDIYRDTACRFHLCGPGVRGCSVRLVGRGAAFGSVKKYLCKALKLKGRSVTEDDLDAEIRGLVAEFGFSAKNALQRLRKLLPGIKLAGHPTWCAFVNPDRDTTPFLPPVNTMPFIRNAFGLGCLGISEEFLLFTYDPNPYYGLKCPTVADAGDYPYFRPAPADAEHGWTQPLDLSQPGISPQPEAVHEALEATASGLMLNVVL